MNNIDFTPLEEKGWYVQPHMLVKEEQDPYFKCIAVVKDGKVKIYWSCVGVPKSTKKRIKNELHEFLSKNKKTKRKTKKKKR